MVKADGKFSYTDEEGKSKAANFSNFDLLRKEVDHLKEVVNAQGEIMRENKLRVKREAPLFDQEVIFSELLTPSAEEVKED